MDTDRERGHRLAAGGPDRSARSLYGDALLTAIGAGLVPTDTSWNTMAGTVEPASDSRAVNDQLYAIYRSLYPATIDQAHALAGLQIGR